MTPKSEIIWDPMLRLFHWALAALVIANIVIGKISPNDMSIHFYLGYATIALLGFRILWGLIGPRNARFASFIYGPRTTLAYLKTLPKRAPSHWAGHNPMGALSVFALLGIVIAQNVTGLFADPEDYINQGPLAKHVSSSTTQSASQAHETIATLLIILVILHVGAILFYKFWKGENLVKPMITGRRD